MATDPLGAGEGDEAVGNGATDSVATAVVETEKKVVFDVLRLIVLVLVLVLVKNPEGAEVNCRVSMSKGLRSQQFFISVVASPGRSSYRIRIPYPLVFLSCKD